MKEFEKLAKEAEKRFKEKGVTEEDVEKAIKLARSRKH